MKTSEATQIYNAIYGADLPYDTATITAQARILEQCRSVIAAGASKKRWINKTRADRTLRVMNYKLAFIIAADDDDDDQGMAAAPAPTPPPGGFEISPNLLNINKQCEKLLVEIEYALAVMA